MLRVFTEEHCHLLDQLHGSIFVVGSLQYSREASLVDILLFCLLRHIIIPSCVGSNLTIFVAISVARQTKALGGCGAVTTERNGAARGRRNLLA